MEKIDAGYLYELGHTIRSMNQLAKEDSAWIWRDRALQVRTAVNSFVEYSIYSEGLRTSRAHGMSFVHALDNLINLIDENDFGDDIWPKIQGHVMQMFGAFHKFEPVMIAELQAMPVFLVPPRGAFDNAYLIDRGAALFPESLLLKAPETELDVQQAGRCIAFNLPTAAGFHMHRANEAVLRRYYDEVMGRGNRPSVETMGTLLAALKKAEKGDTNIIAVLDALKQFHRNPLMHPEHTLGDLDEAINLYSAIRAAIGYMLEHIPHDMSSETAENLLMNSISSALSEGKAG